MRAEHTGYVVPGWGTGDLWTGDGIVLAHELELRVGAGDAAGAVLRPSSVSPDAGGERPEPAATTGGARPPFVEARPPEGAARPPTRTLAAAGARVGDGSVPISPHVATPAGTRGRPARPPSLEPANLVRRFTRFFEGSDETFDDVPIDLDWTTPFQRAVAGALREIPRGEVVAYGELASLAGYPGAGRAVGTFCAHNRFMLIVPCHRVVGATGLGGYGAAGIEVKRRLLALEGVDL